MTGYCVLWKCLVAWFLDEESQQLTWPHDWHSRSCTQTVPSAKHSSHASGVFGVGKSFTLSPFRCSHEVAMRSSYLQRSEPVKPAVSEGRRILLKNSSHYARPYRGDRRPCPKSTDFDLSFTSAASVQSKVILVRIKTPMPILRLISCSNWRSRERIFI